ncbi:hypothetical protein [Zooshikella harenae]|uniref:Uncharacterized protein n=1 Tax=Zooshikella harenae TaxID=2827238 RepID=A0ABS5ZK80_9GAMM|nr:hypothetical protein [Zooshikella harenae]MBU2714350.1 hypothetical protein [Zooshikella harenae]
MERVLIVEQVFGIGKRGVLVSPWLPLSVFEGKMLPTQVQLKTPDGKTLTKAAHFSIPRQSPPPKEYVLGCFIKNIIKEECPIGTEVWAEFCDKQAE